MAGRGTNGTSLHVLGNIKKREGGGGEGGGGGGGGGGGQ